MSSLIACHVTSLKKEADREECLEKFCNLEADICSLRSAAKSTQKCTTGDLKRLARRIVLEAKAKGHAKIEEEDVQQALAGFLPTALSIEHPMPLDMANLKWEDVGGLHNVKQILTEVFIWPTKYPLLYRNNSLRLGRGVLLYGPSGCGKTLISKILATQCGFNVILIKGPELLSKYIGESEENVRKTFERARTTSPCLIFFDEFDSIGPKRGDGDTGVTDRIVNQLLTELDGVEALEGVYVLAATNRIDLIDGALLRPGRFDYVIKCELPGKEDRKSILDILCRSLNLADDVDLEAIAAATDGWTGADLKGLIVNAQVNAYRRSENAFTEKGMNLDLEKCSRSYAISQADLFFSMDESQSKIKRSSVTNRERHISRMLTTLA